MTTTIQISDDLQKELARRKLFDRESYEEIIWDMIEDMREVNEETKRDIARSKEEIKKGKTHKLSDIKKELGL